MLQLNNVIPNFSNLHNYFNNQVCLSVSRPSIPSFSPIFPFCHITLPIPAITSQNVTNESCLECVKSEKYAFFVTFGPLRSMRQGEAELYTSRY